MESTGPGQALSTTTPKLSETEVDAVMQAWVNECGGALLQEIDWELQQQAKGLIIQTNPELLNETSRIFQEAEMTELEHLAWRETRMRTACLVEYIKIFTTMNPSILAEDDELTISRPFQIPSITRKQLEAAVAKEYIRHRGEFAQAEVPHTEEKAKTEGTECSAGPTSSKPTTAPALTYEDLEDDELEAEQIVERYLHIKMSRSSEHDKYEQKETLLKNLSQAAHRASKKEESGRLDPPIRVSKTINGAWFNIAIVKKGPGGRKGRNKYKLIRQDVPEGKDS